MDYEPKLILPNTTVDRRFQIERQIKARDIVKPKHPCFRWDILLARTAILMYGNAASIPLTQITLAQRTGRSSRLWKSSAGTT